MNISRFLDVINSFALLVGQSNQT